MRLPSVIIPKFLRPEENRLSRGESFGILLAIAFSIALTAIVSIFIIQFINSDIFFAKILGISVNTLEYGLLKLTFVSGASIEDLEGIEFYLGGELLESIHSTDEEYKIGSALFYQAPEKMRGTTQSVSVYGIFRGNIYQELYKGSVSVTV